MLARACLFAAMLSIVPASARADAASDFARHKLELELREVRAERAATTRLWPVMTFALGAAAVVAGSVAGAASVLSCEGSCSTPPWTSFAVVSGALVGTLGAIWWVNTEHEISQLDLRVHRVEQDLERQRRFRGAASGVAAPHAQLSLRMKF